MDPATSRRVGLAVLVVLLLAAVGVVVSTPPSGSPDRTTGEPTPAWTVATDCGCGPPMHLTPWGTATPANETTTAHSTG